MPQCIDLLAAIEKLPQSAPYSKDVKSDQSRAALETARVAFEIFLAFAE